MDKQKTILFKIWKYPQLSETFITSQIITAIKCGFQVNILVEDLCDIEQSGQRDLIEKYSLNKKFIKEDYKIPSNRAAAYLKALLRVFLNFNNIPKLLKFLKGDKNSRIRRIYQFHFYSRLKNFDIIHVQFGTNAKPLDVLKDIGLINSKLVVSFHGHDLYFPINKRIFDKAYYHVLFNVADLLVVNTPYLKDILRRLNAPTEKIRTIPVSVDTEFFRPLESVCVETNPVIKFISVGRLEKFKGHSYGVECVQELKARGFKIEYIIVGQGSQKDFMQKLISKDNLDTNVTLVGKKSQKEIRELLRNSHLFLMTSVTDPDYGAESQGLVTAEAQACGVPVIAFDSGGVKFTVEEGRTGYIVPEKNVGCMASKAKYLIENPAIRNQMKQNARNFILKNYSDKALIEKWQTIYNNLMIS